LRGEKRHSARLLLALKTFIPEDQARQNWGMPDWKNPGDYEFTKKLGRDRRAWTWEFMRRNPEYRADYTKSLVTTPPVYEPPKKDDETDNGWRIRIIDAGGEPLKLAGSVWFALKWSMRPPLCDPNGKEKPRFDFAFPKQPSFEQVHKYYEDDENDEPDPPISHFAVLAFNLGAPIPAQLDVARVQLLKRQAALKPEKPRNLSPNKWIALLRLLDAEAAGAKPKEIRAHIHIYKSLSASPDHKHRAADLFADHRQVAHALQADPLSILY
jgi:hypothetical protein